MRLFARFNDVGVTVLIATHDLELDRAVAAPAAEARGRAASSPDCCRRGLSAAMLDAALPRPASAITCSTRCAGSRRQPFATLLTVLVIAIALALPAGLRVLVNNLGTLTGGWQGAADFAVYLKIDVSTDRARRARARDRARGRTSRACSSIDRAAALEEFRAHSGFGEALDALEGNPLPRYARRPARERRRRATSRRSRPRSARCRRPTSCSSTRHWVARLRAMLALAARMVDLATVLLGDRGRDRRRQHDPPGDPQPQRRDRGHEAGRRHGRLRPPAVPLPRVLLRAGRRHRRGLSSWPPLADPGAAGRRPGGPLRQRLPAGGALAAGDRDPAWSAAPCWAGPAPWLATARHLRADRAP